MCNVYVVLEKRPVENLAFLWPTCKNSAVFRRGLAANILFGLI